MMRSGGSSALLAAAVALALSAATTQVKAAPAARPHGSEQVVVTGVGAVDAGDVITSSLVVDPRGGSHLLTYAPYTRTGGRLDTYHYVSARPGRQPTVTTVKPPPGDVYEQVKTVLSLNGKRVYGVLATCRGLWTSSASTRSTTMPEFTLAFPSGLSCHPPDYPLLIGAAALPHGKLAILALTREFATLYSGTPGSANFALATGQPPRPTPNGGEWDGMTRDEATGELVLSAADFSTTSRYDVKVVAGTSKNGWSPVADAAATSRPYGYSVAASNGAISLVFSRTGSYDPSTPAIFLVNGTESGTWQPPVTPPWAAPNDVDAIPAIDPDGRLTLAYEHCTIDGSRVTGLGTIETTRRDGSTWSAAQPQSQLRTTQIGDLDFGVHGQPVIGFVRFVAPGSGAHSPCDF